MTAQDDSLELGKTVERELASQQKHVYKIQITANQYLQISLEQKGIDVALTLIGPDNSPITEVDAPNGRQGPMHKSRWRNPATIIWKSEREKTHPVDVCELPSLSGALPAEDLKRFRATLAQMKESDCAG
jgi:hypothetical protein